jgi:CheY-like chemotaxis protein
VHNERVLFLEDDRVSAAVSCATLSDHGYNVVQVHDAAAAYLELDQGKPLSVLMTDINLGPGDDGFAAARYARALYPDLSVIYMSAVNILAYGDERASGSTFLAKPYRQADLLRALTRTGRRAVP